MKSVFLNTFLVFAICGLSAQTTKVYQESFITKNNTVLELNTSHTDIQFDTWDKDLVEITATVTIEGATQEQLEQYLNNEPFRISGNSKTIEVNTGVENTWFFKHSTGGLFPDVKNSFFEDNSFPPLPPSALQQLPPIPPLPPMVKNNFDYQRYEKEGEAYMEKWRKDFEENLSKDFELKMEEWAQKMVERNEKFSQRMEERKEKMNKAQKKKIQEMEKKREEMMSQREKQRIERRQEMNEARAKLWAEKELKSVRLDSLQNKVLELKGKNIFLSEFLDGDSKIKIKKTLEIKMPKSLKVKMNVRHGEVKLASLTTDLNANLSYSSLLGSTINGKNTFIEAAYSPVVITNWEWGNMNAKYCDKINLGAVSQMKLNAISSNIKVNSALNDLHIENEFGSTEIESIATDSKRIFVNLSNGELLAKMPLGDYNVYLYDKSSKVFYPRNINVKMQNHPSLEGDFVFSGSNKGILPAIIINSEYSEVVLEK